MQAIQFHVPYHHGDRLRYEPGKFYPTGDDEAFRCLARGWAEYVEVPDDLIEVKTGVLDVVELVAPVDQAAVLRAQLEQQKADAAAQAAAIAAAEAALAALEAVNAPPGG